MPDNRCDAVFNTVPDIRKELIRVSSNGHRFAYDHFFKAIRDRSIADHLVLYRSYDLKTGVSTYRMKNSVTGEQIK